MVYFYHITTYSIIKDSCGTSTMIISPISSTKKNGTTAFASVGTLSPEMLDPTNRLTPIGGVMNPIMSNRQESFCNDLRNVFNRHGLQTKKPGHDRAFFSNLNKIHVSFRATLYLFNGFNYTNVCTFVIQSEIQNLTDCRQGHEC